MPRQNKFQLCCSWANHIKTARFSLLVQQMGTWAKAQSKHLVKIPFFIVTFALLLLIILLGFSAFNANIRTNLNITDRENFSAMASQEQAAFNSVIKNTIDSLTSITNTLVALGDDTQAKIQFLHNIEKSFSLDTIIMADVHGQGIRSTGQEVDVTPLFTFQEAIKGHVTATDMQLSEFTGQYAVTVSIPMREAGNILGVLIVEYGTKFITELLENYTDSAGSAFLVDTKGFPVASSSDVFRSLKFLQKAQFSDDMHYEEFLQHALKRQWGGTSFTLNGEERLIEYRPISINDWILFVISRDVSVNPVHEISKEIQYVATGILFIFLLFCAYIVFLKRKTIAEVKHAAFYDELTGLSNTLKFKQDVERTIKKFPNMKYVMQKLDLENFKAINEMYDYETGNRVLIKIAQALTQLSNDSFLCARNGNDEFLMFSAYGFLNDDSTRTEFERHFKQLLPDLATYEFTFRYGRYFVPKGERDVTEMISKTTLAHSMAKSLGHKHTWDYDDTFRQEVRRHTELINLSKNALENMEFTVYIQPIFDIVQKKVTGGEALVRWSMDDGTQLLPQEFIPIFEQNGFITEIDFHVLRTVCARIKLWIEKGHKALPISVNFSQLHLKNPHFVKEITEICAEYGNLHHLITVELTETAMTENAHDLAQLLDDLHQAGFTVAIDDFGAGYSSLGMLKNFKVDILKLDKSFFEANEHESRGTIVVNGISAIAHDLGMKIIAEGIEFSEQFTPVKANQLELAQGYFLAKPMPLEEFEQNYFE